MGEASISVIRLPETQEELDGFLFVDEKSGEVLGGYTDLDLTVLVIREKIEGEGQ